VKKVVGSATDFPIQQEKAGSSIPPTSRFPARPAEGTRRGSGII